MEGDKEELALNLNGKKRKINLHDFQVAMATCHVPEKAVCNIFKKFEQESVKWPATISKSFMPEATKMEMVDLVK